MSLVRLLAILLLALLLSEVAAVALVEGTRPASTAPPILTDPLVKQAIGNSTASQTAYGQTIRSVQNLSTLWVNSLDENFWANASGLPNASSGTLSGVTFLNTTNSCVKFNCQPNDLYCDRTNLSPLAMKASLRFNLTCSSLRIRYNGPLPLGPVHQYINFTITRVDTWFSVQPAAWLSPGNGTNALAVTQNFTIPAASSLKAAGLGAFGNIELVWVVRYPAGSWDPSRTTVYSVNASSFVVPVVQLNNTVVLYLQAPLPGNQTFTITLYGTPGSGRGLGSTGGVPPNQIILDAENISHISGNLYQASARWTNIYSSPFTGSVVLTGSWAATATNESAYVNANPTGTVASGSSVTIPAGTLNVTNGTTVVFRVTFLSSSPFSFGNAIAFLNHYSLSIALLFLLGALVIGIVLSYLAIVRNVGPKKVRPLLPSIVAILLMALLWSIWLVV